MSVAGGRAVIGFDSASAMVRALGRHLHGRDVPLLGQAPRWLQPPVERLGAALNALPDPVKTQVYAWSGWGEALRMDQLEDVRAEALSRWVTRRYPRRRFPAAFIGSSNGAMLHLAAALGAPWLPQTLLMAVRRHGVDADDPKGDLQAVQEGALRLLDTNPELQLHHMHDANQDRLMIQHMTYFRVKRRVLGRVYERFLRERLAPGAPIVLVDCGLRWPGTRVGERYVFQHGALGGLDPEEYEKGSERVERFLARQGSPLRRWDYPTTTGEYAEAEWGFEPTLAQDVERFAREHGHPVRRLRFEHPEDLSPLVADFHMQWLESRGIPPRRLLVEQFLLQEPYWTLRTGSVPFWSVFNTQQSARRIREYLDRSGPFDEIHLTAFSNGIEAAGQASIEDWRDILRQAREEASLLGVDEARYPRDFAVFARFHADLVETIRARHPLPPPLAFADLDDWMRRAQHRYPVTWTSEAAAKGLTRRPD